MKPNTVHTQRSEKTLRELVSTIVVKYKDAYHPCKALWDTGATITTISTRVADKLEIEYSRTEKYYHADGITNAGKCSIDVIFPPCLLQLGDVSIVDLPSGYDMLIGMDIISQGDFSITNVDGHTTFSFRIPSMKEIDYLKEEYKD